MNHDTLRERIRAMFAACGDAELSDLMEENADLHAEIERLKKQVNDLYRELWQHTVEKLPNPAPQTRVCVTCYERNHAWCLGGACGCRCRVETRLRAV